MYLVFAGVVKDKFQPCLIIKMYCIEVLFKQCRTSYALKFEKPLRISNADA